MEKRITKEERNAVIVSSFDMIQDYELDQLYKIAVKERIKDKYGICIVEQLINPKLSIEDNFTCYFDKNISKKYGNIETYKKFQDFKFLSEMIRNFEGDTLKTSSLRVNSLIYLMEYVVKGIIHDNFAEANRIQDASKMQYDQSNWDFTNFNEYGDVQVKKFKNGNLVFKGLTNEQRTRLIEIVELLNR